MGEELDHVGRMMAQWQVHRPDVDQTPLAVIGRVQRIADRLGEERDALYASFGLTFGEFEVLAALLRQGAPHELAPSEIAEWTLVSSSAVTKRVDRCAAQGWVTRRSGLRDGRSRVVALTEEGLALANRIYTAQTAKVHELVSALEESDRTHLADTLEHWGRALNA